MSGRRGENLGSLRCGAGTSVSPLGREQADKLADGDRTCYRARPSSNMAQKQETVTKVYVPTLLDIESEYDYNPRI